MKIQLKKSSIEPMEFTSEFQVKKLTLEGLELEEETKRISIKIYRRNIRS